MVDISLEWVDRNGINIITMDVIVMVDISLYWEYSNGTDMLRMGLY